MGISKIRVNTDSLQSDASAIADSIGVIERGISKLESEYAVLDGMWDGPANEVFKVAYRNDIEELRSIVANLKKFNVFEVEAKDKYNSCESQVGNIVSSIKC